MIEVIQHGESRNHRTETSFAPAEVWKTTDGISMPIIPSSRTQTVCEKYCARCGWIEVRGMGGALTWIIKHEDHDKVPTPTELERIMHS